MTHRIIIGPLVALSLLLAGCAEMHHGFEAVGRVGSSPPAPAEGAEVAPLSRSDIKTVRPRGTPRVPTSETSAAEPATVTASAVPSPRQIFDFHPAGSAPETFRQPFVIDPNDGPLTAVVQRSAKELREFKAGLKSGTNTAERKRCSETDVATAKPGCVTPGRKAATAAGQSVSTLQ